MGKPLSPLPLQSREGAPVDLVWGRRGVSEGVSLWPEETLGCGGGRVVPEGLALRPITTPGRGGGRAALVDTGGKNLLTRFFFFFIFLDTDPHLASVCVISISFLFRDMSCVCVCGNLCMCVHMNTNLESPPTMGNFKV